VDFEKNLFEKRGPPRQFDTGTLVGHYIILKCMKSFLSVSPEVTEKVKEYLTATLKGQFE